MTLSKVVSGCITCCSRLVRPMPSEAHSSPQTPHPIHIVLSIVMVFFVFDCGFSSGITSIALTGQISTHLPHPLQSARLTCEVKLEVTMVFGQPCLVTPSIILQQHLQQWHMRLTFFLTLSAVRTSFSSFERAKFSSICDLDTSLAKPFLIAKSATDPKEEHTSRGTSHSL